MDPMIEDVCGAVDAASMMRHLETFALRVKLSGTPEERESFDYLRSQLDSYGLRTELMLHDAYISLPGEARLNVGDQTPECITHSFSRSSAPEGVRARIVYAGAGTPEAFANIDAAGKIVLLEGIATPAVSMRASRAGAVGQIHISPVEHLYEMCISPVWGSPTLEQRALLPTTVVVTVRRAAGDAIKKRLEQGETVAATLHAQVDTRWRQTPILEANLYAEAPQDDSFVLFSGHHDTWYCGLMDNGGANAVMLEAARVLARHRKSLRRHLRICFWSGHSHGRYSGSAWYAETRYQELARHCVAHVNIDSVGATGNTVLADALSSHELFAVAAEAVRQHGEQELAGQRMSRAGDQSFWGIGIPSVFMAMGEQPAGSGTAVMGPAMIGNAARKGAGFGWWWHTPDDTIDKIDPALLTRDARIYMHTLGRLLTDDVLPLDIVRQLDMLGHELATLAEAVGNRISLAPLISRTASLGLLARELRTRLGQPTEQTTSIVNHVLMATCRQLVPIDYTHGDRYGQDPALKQGPYPVLEPLRVLAKTVEDSDESRFAAVAARRVLNLVGQALEQAHVTMQDGLRELQRTGLRSTRTNITPTL